jgi:hypothetical protein
MHPPHEQAGENKYGGDAGEIDGQEQSSARPRSRRSHRQKLLFLGVESVKIGGDLLHRLAAGRARRDHGDGRSVALRVPAHQRGAGGQPAIDDRPRFLEQCMLARIVFQRVLQLVERGGHLCADVLEFLREALVTRQRKTARDAFRTPDEQVEVRNLLQHVERMIDPNLIRMRLDVHRDRGRTDQEQKSEADRECQALRRHGYPHQTHRTTSAGFRPGSPAATLARCWRYTSVFKHIIGSSPRGRCGMTSAPEWRGHHLRRFAAGRIIPNQILSRNRPIICT